MKPIPTRRAAAPTVLVAVSGLVLLAAACGSGTAATGSGGSSSASALAFSRCMRSQGVPTFPDPSGSGDVPKETAQQLGVGSAQLQAAESACRHLLPNSGQPTQAVLQQSWSDMASFARCMRSHGVSNWPDPTRYPQHPERPTFDLQPAGIDPNSPRISPAIHDCVPLLNGDNPQHLGEGGS